MLMMNRTLRGLGIPCPRTKINSDVFSILQTMPLTIHTGGAEGVDTHVEHQVWSSVCGVHPTLSPRALDPARLGRRHAYGHPGRISIRSTRLPSINIQYLQRNYHVIKPASLVFALGYFDELRKHVLGGAGRSVAVAQLLLKPVCLIWIRNSGIGGIPPCNNINPVKA